MFHHVPRNFAPPWASWDPQTNALAFGKPKRLAQTRLRELTREDKGLFIDRAAQRQCDLSRVKRRGCADGKFREVEALAPIIPCAE